MFRLNRARKRYGRRIPYSGINGGKEVDVLSMFYSNETNVSVPLTFASPWYALVR